MHPYLYVRVAISVLTLFKHEQGGFSAFSIKHVQLHEYDLEQSDIHTIN